MSRLILTSPRDRREGLISFPAPGNAPWKDAAVIRLFPQDGSAPLLAERDPEGETFSCLLPEMGQGGRVYYHVEAVHDAEPAGGLEVRDTGGRLDLLVEGADFATFHYDQTYPKPVWNPILTPRGRNMLRAPMPAWGEGEHPWQRGLTLMQGAINGIDCWNEARGPKHGRTEQDKMEIVRSPLSTCINTRNTWYAEDKPLMSDDRMYRFFDTGRECIVLDIRLTARATHGDVVFGGTKEAGFLCIRVNPSMNADAGGRMENSYGALDETGCWSKAAHWVDYVGPVEDETAGFAIFDHPQNLRYPTTWHVRGYGLFAPNCWMFRDDVPMPSGASLTFRWRVLIHTGTTAETSVRGRFLDYVDGPRMGWEE